MISPLPEVHINRKYYKKNMAALIRVFGTCSQKQPVLRSTMANPLLKLQGLHASQHRTIVHSSIMCRNMLQREILPGKRGFTLRHTNSEFRSRLCANVHRPGIGFHRQYARLANTLFISDHSRPVSSYTCCGVNGYQGRITPLFSCNIGQSQVRAYSSDAADDGADDGSGEEGSSKETSAPPPEDTRPAIHNIMGALTPVTVPDSVPTVPVIAMNRNPIFPRFAKMIEVSIRKMLVVSEHQWSMHTV
jgi:hypothetical protein